MHSMRVDMPQLWKKGTLQKHVYLNNGYQEKSPRKTNQKKPAKMTWTKHKHNNRKKVIMGQKTSIAFKMNFDATEKNLTVHMGSLVTAVPTHKERLKTKNCLLITSKHHTTARPHELSWISSRCFRYKKVLKKSKTVWAFSTVDWQRGFNWIIQNIHYAKNGTEQSEMRKNLP